MILRDDLIQIGVYNKPHGINGEISASFDYDIEIIENIDCLVSNINGIFVPFFVEGYRPKTNSTLLVKVDGIDNESKTKILVNQKIYVLKSVFNKYKNNEIDGESDELPLDYFIGFKIITTEDNLLGIISNVDCSTENFLFIVNHNNQDILVPATEDFITDIDIENKILTMSLPDGLLEI